MNRVLILDSDFENIKQLKNCIKKADPQIKFIYTVINANEDAVRIIKDNNVNLVFFNVSFYKTKTLGVIEEISNLPKRVNTIFFGHLSEEEYLKKYAELTGGTYIIRPIKQQDISKAFEYIKEAELKEKAKEEANQDILELCSHNKDLFIDKFLQGLVSGNIRKRSEILESLNYFSIPLDLGFRIIIIRIDNYKRLILALEDLDKHILVYRLQACAHQVFENYKHITFFTSLNEVIIITNGQEDTSNCFVLAEQLKELIFEETQVSVTIGMGRYYREPDEIYISYNEALSALKYRFLLGYNTVIPIEHAEPFENITYRFTPEKKSKLVFTAIVGEFEYCEQQLNKIFQDLEDFGDIPDGYYALLVHTIVLEIETYSATQKLDVKEFYAENVDYSKIKKIEHQKEAKQILLAFLEKFCAFVLNERENYLESIYKLASSYIEDHYMETFSLAKIALELQTSPDVLDNIFQKYSNKTTYEFLQTYRMEVAKKFLRETTFDDDFIAVRVGYDSQYHFKAMFKQIEGRTTDEYRRKFNLALNTNRNSSY